MLVSAIAAAVLLVGCEPPAPPTLPVRLIVRPADPVRLLNITTAPDSYSLFYDPRGRLRMMTPLAAMVRNGHSFDSMPRPGFAWRSYDGGKWSETEPLFASPDRKVECWPGRLASCVDTKGRVHLLWNETRESYGIGVWIVDGALAAKPWHAIFENGRWSEPQPVAGPSRWAYGDICLTAAADGTVHMAADVAYMDYFSRGRHLIEHRSFANGGWSQSERFSPWAYPQSPTLAVDRQGDLHCIFRRMESETDSRAATIHYVYQVRHNGVWCKPRHVAGEVSLATMGNDLAGRVYCLWLKRELPATDRAFVQVWNDRQASEPTDLGPISKFALPRLIQTPEGGMGVAWDSKGSFKTQSFRVEEMKRPSSTPEQRVSPPN
jgi:hypothetical protein